MLKALEFFAGIGAFKLVADEFGIEVVEAFDQSEEACLTYEANFGRRPRQRNLDTISSADLPDADFWWLSPPCKPFTRRGKRNDLDDTRSLALQNLLKNLGAKLPAYLAMENVEGFAGSRGEALLLETLTKLNYHVNSLRLSPHFMGIPMKRPRIFYVASLREPTSEMLLKRNEESILQKPIAAFLQETNDADQSLILSEEIRQRYGDGLNIISASDPYAKAICFTSGYAKSLRTSGSFIELSNGRIRRFSPEEILALMDFPQRFYFPDEIALVSRYRLAGNSIDLRSLRMAIQALLQ